MHFSSLPFYVCFDMNFVSLHRELVIRPAPLRYRFGTHRQVESQPFPHVGDNHPTILEWQPRPFAVSVGMRRELAAIRRP